jgi:hypothetical protein
MRLGARYTYPYFPGLEEFPDKRSPTPPTAKERLVSRLKRRTFQPAELIERSSTQALEAMQEMLTNGTSIALPPGLLGDYFFQYCFESPADVLGWSADTQESKATTVAIHFRGGDFHRWDPSAILPTDYYHRAIAHLEGLIGDFSAVIYTDDPSLPAVGSVAALMGDRARVAPIGPPVSDLRAMSQSRYLIASPSTFAIWAGLLGNQVETVHSLDWVKRKAQDGEAFWQKILSGAQDRYRVEALV